MRFMIYFFMHSAWWLAPTLIIFNIQCKCINPGVPQPLIPIFIQAVVKIKHINVYHPAVIHTEHWSEIKQMVACGFCKPLPLHSCAYFKGLACTGAKGVR